ncbi:MAG TPA: hypothetical protein VFU21_14935 [Kofleriaceae bacterium]|nr:hypothetical protein [Kofleriaceae bacterium]
MAGWARILLFAALSSCTGSSARPRTAAPPPRRASEQSRPADRAAPPAEVRVEIIQAGRGPRRALRYLFRPDRLGVMSTFFDMDIGYRTGEGAMIHTPSPPMEMDLELTAMSVERGVARVTHRISRLDVVTSASDATDESTRAAVRQRLQPMVGMTGTMAMDDRGRLLELSWNMPDNLAPEIRATLENFSRSGGDMVVPLPEEPVGVGAEWYAVKETPFMGIKMANTSRVKVLALDGDRVTLSYSTDISAGAQPFAFPGLPQGTTAELRSCDGSGSSEIDLDLGWMAPTRMSVQSRTEMTMELTTGQQVERVLLQVRLTMETRRR